VVGLLQRLLRSLATRPDGLGIKLEIGTTGVQLIKGAELEEIIKELA
jgi:hypothetical protein